MIKLSQIQIKLSEAIRHCGKTQTELAAALNIKQPQISCYVKGTKMPSLETFANLCAVMDVDANDILCVSDCK